MKMHTEVKLMYNQRYTIIHEQFVTVLIVPTVTQYYYMAQATSGEITCSHWLRRVTCWSVSFRIGPLRITGFVSRFVYKRTRKGNYEKPQKLNEFSKLSTRSCMSRTMNNLKESFTIMKAITRKTILKMSRYTYVRYAV